MLKVLGAKPSGSRKFTPSAVNKKVDLPVVAAPAVVIEPEVEKQSIVPVEPVKKTVDVVKEKSANSTVISSDISRSNKRSSEVLDMLAQAGDSKYEKVTPAASTKYALKTQVMNGSLLPPSLFGVNCAFTLHNVYLRKISSEGIGIKLKNIDDVPVIVGFLASFETDQPESQYKKVQLYDSVVSINNTDIHTKRLDQKRRKLDSNQPSSNFYKIVEALRKVPTASSGVSSNLFVQSNASLNGYSGSVGLSTIDSSIVCLTLARPAVL